MFFFKKKETLFGTALSGPVSFIIAGLGNPGSKYENTRHNAGFMAADALADQLNIKVSRLRLQALCGEGMIGSNRILLMKPTTFMNNSGEAIAQAARFYKIPPEHILIFSDDISLEPGRLRVRGKGSAGGHNGLKSIIALLGSENFPRIKIGVGQKPHTDYDLADWVLGRLGEKESLLLKEACTRAAEAASMIVSGKMDQAMNLYNASPAKQEPEKL